MRIFARQVPALVCSAMLLVATHAFSQAPAPLAQLLEKERTVEASPPPDQPWVSAEKGRELMKREKIAARDLSRAVVRMSSEYLVRVNANTQLVILPSLMSGRPLGLEVQKGEIYLHSRGQPTEVGIKTPVVEGNPFGTQFRVSVAADGTTTFTMFEGEVELVNVHGRERLGNNEQAIVEPGRAPRKTAVIMAQDTIQWCLYYPGVVHVPELKISPEDLQGLREVIAAYNAGDLLGALDRWPAGYRPRSDGAKVLRAMVVLAVGQVDDARVALAGTRADSPGRRAIEEMMDAVNFRVRDTGSAPQNASEWLARSYYEQSRGNLQGALDAARESAKLAEPFGYAAARVAELEFSFGRTIPALRELKRGLELAPHNAQAHALKGFLLSAQNRIGEARAEFEEAIRLDGALGNAWLGRGLCSIREGKATEGRRDLQTATILEPNRSLFHSYLGKAASQVGLNETARHDLDFARKLDKYDPTPWLYSAIQYKQENRYNEAVADLEKSLELNDERKLYRSGFLLDQDRAVRSANLAAIYQNDGMTEVSIREAVRAVDSNYASAPAHLFLANSLNSLRDPRRVQLRYETPWFNELLLANLLSPVGGGSLSQYVSQQEYSKLFESDGLGISTVTDYYSTGEMREVASQFGTFGNFSYALDAEYNYSNGLRPNNRLSRFEGYATMKLQLGPQDTIFMQVKYQDLENGDIFQRYDPDIVGLEVTRYVTDANGMRRKVVEKNVSANTYDFRERQEPGLALAGWHHEWSPDNHTLLLLGRLANDQVLTADDTHQLLFERDITKRFPRQFDASDLDPARPLDDRAFRSALNRFLGKGQVVRAFSMPPLDLDYRASFEIYSGELAQIVNVGPHTFVIGGRWQRGQFETYARLDDLDQFNQASGLFLDPPARANTAVDFERMSVYLYDMWRVAPWLSITAGIAWDHAAYPENYRTPPIDEGQADLDQFSPKAGFILKPTRWTTLRGAYTEGISGASFDQSVRLEPTQVAGFTQAYRTLISEDLIGAVAGSRFRTTGLSLEQKLPTRTYIGVEYNVLQQRLDRVVGAFDYLSNSSNFDLSGVLPSRIGERLEYREDVLAASLNQLVGANWSFGARYSYTLSKLRDQYRGVSNTLLPGANATLESGLHQAGLFALYNHSSGFFARAEANWYSQENDTYTPGQVRPRNDPAPGDDFWQLNAIAGYRYFRNQCEISGGILNITGEDYRLSPLNPYLELPRDRTLFVRVKFNF